MHVNKVKLNVLTVNLYGDQLKRLTKGCRRNVSSFFAGQECDCHGKLIMSEI